MAEPVEYMEEEELVDELVSEFDAAKAANKTDAYIRILGNSRADDPALKVKEQCIYSLARLYSAQKQLHELMPLLKTNNEFFAAIPKARTAKIVRVILDLAGEAQEAGSNDKQVQLCRDVIAWCVAEKRTFLRQRVEGKLASLLLDQKTTTSTHEALKMINSLLAELKKLDDKQLLTETHLAEARIYHAMENIPKSKAALTASRSASTSIYVVPLLQAELDEMSGILHCEEGDVVTAFSYFLESYEALDNANDKRALTVLKYMTLCKILSVSAQSVTQGNSNADANALATAANEVHHLFSGKYALKYGGPDMEAMKAIAGAAEHRSLQEFKDALTVHGQYLKTNHLIAHNLDQLYGNMFESNLLKIIQPYSCVELEHVAKMILLPVDQVARKLAQMILDAKFNGILEQKLGHLIIYDAASADINYTRTLEVIGNMTHVVEALSGRAKRINTTAKADAAAAAVAEKVEAAAAVEKK